MRIAALYDIHGNLPALDAVLRELGGFDAVVVGGDVVAGPMPRETLERLAALTLPVHWVCGNADRSVVAAFDGTATPDPQDLGWRADSFAAQRLEREHRDLLAALAPAVTIAGTLFCHGSPRSDEEILTAATPVERLRSALAGVDARLVVGGHTHMQADRDDGPVRYVNAGSVGMPYEAVAGHAFWLALEDGVPAHRRTPYDADAAERAIRATGFPDADDLVAESLRGGAQPADVARLFESMADSRSA